MEHFLLQSSFNDFEELSLAVRAWDLDFQQLDRGDCRADLLQFASNKSLLGYARFNRLFEQRGSAPPGNWTFAIFTGHSTPIVWHEQEISNDTIVVYRPGSEIDCVSRPGFEVFTLSYTEECLNGIAASLGLPAIGELLRGADHFACSSIELAESRNHLHRITEGLYSNSFQDSPPALTNELDYTLPEQILLILAGVRPVNIGTIRLQKKAIKRVKEHLAENPRETVTVNQLCRIAKVSERTLQYGFLEHFGVTPKTYLKSFRLNKVRRELWKSDPAYTRVNDVANLWGFWHMGQFAADYRKLFGELPSETLNRRK